MKSVRECVVCQSRNLKSRRGSVAPFVADRIWGHQSFSVKLLQCAACGFAFFDPRLEAEEEQRLYSGYRNSEYQRARHSFEPWYTARFHENLSSDATMRERCEGVKRILSPYCSTPEVRSILDFGGGRGELIVDLVPRADRYVYDLSDCEPLTEIQKMKSLTDCKTHRYDLIVCSNVLEHVAYPKEVLRQIVEVASPGTLIFIEVPYESPFSYREKAKRLVQPLIMLLRRPRIALSLVGLGMLYVMHEHVNFFSAAALERLVASLGLEIQASGIYGGESVMDSRMLWSLARRKR